MEIKTAYSKIVGRQPNDKDLQRLLAIQSELGIKNNDAIWAVLLAFEGYHKLYCKIPEQIKEAANLSAQSAAANAQAEVTKAVARLVPTVAKELTTAVQTKATMLNLIGGIASCGLVLLFGVFLGFDIGRQFIEEPSLNWVHLARGMGLGFAAGFCVVSCAIIGAYVKQVGIPFQSNPYFWISGLGTAALVAKVVFF